MDRPEQGLFAPVVALLINGSLIAAVNAVTVYDWTMRLCQLALIMATVAFTAIRAIKAYEEWMQVRRARRGSADGRMRSDPETRGDRPEQGQGRAGEDGSGN
jgi:hypothetical protein